LWGSLVFGIRISRCIEREIRERDTHAFFLCGASLLFQGVFVSDTGCCLFALLEGFLASLGVEECPLARGEVVVLLVALRFIVVAVREISGAGKALALHLLRELAGALLLLLLS
jgi:hypothetical protein